MKISKTFAKWLSPVVLPAALALAVMQPGCGVFGSPGPSAVGQGQEYRSGDPTFDQFFADLHDMQVEMSKAPNEEKENRIALATKLGLEIEEEAPAPAAAPASTPAPAAATPGAPAAAQPPSATDALGQQAMSSVPGLAQFNQVKNQVNQVKGQVDAIKQQANQLGALGNGVSASTQPAAAAPAAAPAAKPEKRAPSASLIARTIKKKSDALSLQLALDIDKKALEENEVKTELRSLPESLDGDGKKLADALHDTARSELKLYVRMVQAKKDLDKLAELATALDATVDAVFKRGGMGKKSEVRKNLEDARALIKLMQERADDVSGKAKEVVDKLAEVASSKLEPPPAEVVDEDKTEEVAKGEPGPATAPAQTKSDAPPALPPEDSGSSKSKSKSKSSSTAASPAKSSSKPAASKPRPAARPVADFQP